MDGFDFTQNKFFPALALEKAFPQRYRKFFAWIFNAGILLLIFLLGFQFLLKFFPLFQNTFYIAFPFLIPAGSKFIGLLYILLAFRLVILALDSFFDSKTGGKSGSDSLNLAERLGFWAAHFWYRSAYSTGALAVGDLVCHFSRSIAGKTLLLRLGVPADEYRVFSEFSRKNRSEEKPLQEFLAKLQGSYPKPETVTFSDVAAGLFDFSDSLKNLSSKHSLTPEAIRKTAEWVEKELDERDLRRRWWGKENLARIPGFGKDWAYGKTPLLDNFTRDLGFVSEAAEEEIIGREREIKLLESTLLKRSGANAVIVGEPGAGKHTLLLGLSRMIRRGEIFPELEHKRILELFGESVVSSGKTKGEVESLLFKILNEALGAGNVILAIDGFPEWVESLASLGISVAEILAPYLASSDIHIIALADTMSFRKILENDHALMKYFQRVEISEPDQEKLLLILEDLAPSMESRMGNRTFVTYPALQKISEAALRYLVEGALPKRAVDLMEAAVEEAVRRDMMLVRPELVMEITGRKTEMPLGKIEKEEQFRLLELESLLRERVVGQEEAVRAAADALRRARSGIQNPQKPIGTFLFLGPTGVGKTETAKTLADVYFGSEDKMARLDMTEYQDEDGVSRLIGSTAAKSPGILASKMRSSPYGLLLLDEFEKAHPTVKNLFLQILDEGFFSDYLGQKINMRNAIIIATSNAGSPKISELTREGAAALKIREEMLSFIQKERILSPELLNRFDAIIIFRPLGREALRKIARLMLEKLSGRLRKQNLLLRITEDLIEAVAEGGYDPALGARPMQRFIQDKIEKAIADKIIKEEVGPGKEFYLSKEEI